MISLWYCKDFNSQPTEALYSLLVGDTLTPAQIHEIEYSQVVHVSIDPSIKSTAPVKNDDDDEGEGQGTASNDKEKQEEDPDKVFTNSRKAIPTDGLLSISELLELYGAHRRHWRSAYGEAHSTVLMAAGGETRENTFGARAKDDPALAVVDGPTRKGQDEPMWTSFTHFWRLTLVSTGI